MRFHMCALICVSSLTVANALAVSVHFGGTSSSMPFELVHRELQSPLQIVLQLANDSDATVSVLAWQLELELRALGGSHGSLLFDDVAAPPEPLFGIGSNPQSDPIVPPPTDMIFVQDSDMDFSAEPIPLNDVRNILRLTLIASSDAAGEFQLVMPIVEDPQVDSSWLDADAFLPRAFENTAATTFPGFNLLGTIHVGQHGDYDLDGAVTAADYERWTEIFGTSFFPPGSGADGNENGIVDAADYVIWRHFASVAREEPGNVRSVASPEPGALVLLCFGMSIAGLFR